MSGAIGHRRDDLEREDASLREEISNMRGAILGMAVDLSEAFTRIGQLEETIREHQIAVPHAESRA